MNEFSRIEYVRIRLNIFSIKKLNNITRITLKKMETRCTYLNIIVHKVPNVL